MKTDTKDTVRVTITFHRASNPEWYEVISGISNGKARSEIVKTHLNLPKLERFAQNRKVQPSDPLDVIKTPAAMMTSSDEIEQKGEVYFPKKVQNPDT